MKSQPRQTTRDPNLVAHAAKKKPPLDPDLLAFARNLRQEHSDPERLKWAILRDRRFCGFTFRRQHPVKPYVLDFYCHEAKLAIELDGGQHNSEVAHVYDVQRTKFISLHCCGSGNMTCLKIATLS